MGKVNTCCNPFGKKSHKSVRKNLYCIDLNSSSLFEDFIGLYIYNSCRVDFYKKKSEADENDSVDDALSNVSFDLEEVDYKSKTSKIFIRNVKRSLKQAKTFHAKVQILSVLPNNFSNYKIRKIFNVSNRLASRSKKAKNNFGLAPLPMKRICRKLPQSTIELVKKFYMSDEISRIMPGMKDCLSIKTSNGRELMQKRLLLFDLTEIFKKFKLEYSQIKIGLSKFKALRPRQCVSAGQSGTHNVCVCKIHQNVELKIKGLQKAFKKKNLVFNEKTEQFLKSCVCHSPSNDCFLLKCEQCPGVDLVKQNLCTRLEEASIEVVEFSSWCSTDRSAIIEKSESYSAFVVGLIDDLKTLITHDFLAKWQAKFFAESKNTAADGEFIVCLDFAENYAFAIQNAIQSFHWANTKMMKKIMQSDLPMPSQ